MARRNSPRRRHKPRIHRRSAPGAAPGTLSVAPDAMQSKVHVMAYATGRLLEQAVDDLERLPGLVAAHRVTWINIIGLEVYREICLDLRDYYVTLVSNRLNEIMKVLTVIATIFMPLSFIASVYGMNFNTKLPGTMPELNVPYGYLVLLLAMFGLSVVMLFSFHRMGWIGPYRRSAGGSEAPSSPAPTTKPADRP